MKSANENILKNIKHAVLDKIAPRKKKRQRKIKPPKKTLDLFKQCWVAPCWLVCVLLNSVHIP